MEIEVVLDTDVIIDYLKRSPDPVAVEIFQKIRKGKLVTYMTSITAFELYRGARLSPQPDVKIKEVKGLQFYINVLPYDEAAADAASEISVRLEKQGEPIDMRDLFIGAIARTVKKTLTTRNVAHFQRIPDLRVILPEDLVNHPHLARE